MRDRDESNIHNATVIRLHEPTATPDEILERAKGQIEDFMLLGLNIEDGGVDVRMSKDCTKERALWIIEQLKLKLLTDTLGVRNT